MDEWKIEKRKGTCDACQTALAPAQDYVAALVDGGAEFARREFCPACWSAQPPEGFYSFWRSRVPPPDAPRRANVAAAAETFDRLLAESPADPRRQRLAFLLSLVLLQRRRLKLIETFTRDGREMLRFERVADAALLEVANPGVPDGELESLKAEMDALLR